MTQPMTCPRCGASIPAGSAPGGLCPRCLLQAGMESKGSAGDIVNTGVEASRRPPPTIEELAPHFPQFELGELLGQGGMGAVYRAQQKGLDRDVALKVLTVEAGSDPSFADRFGREAKTLASLAHTSIVHVYDFGRAGPWYYLVMELVEGASLRQMLRAKTVSPREAMSIVAQMCDALQYAHDEGVVHRDIKPENVLVGRKGAVKILDFGLAKLLRRGGPDPLTRTQQVMGTPYYMAPEQWERPLEVDHRADIYSLGVVFYELLTGELPVGRFGVPSSKVEVDVRLDEVVVKTLEKEPALRYQHVSQVKTEVDRIATGPPVFAHAAAGLGAVPAARKRAVWPWIVVPLVLVIPIALAMVLALLYVGGERYQATTAQAEPIEPPVPPESPDATAPGAPPAPRGATMAASAIPWRLDAATAASIGIPESERARVNQVLETARKGYRALDLDRVQVEEVSPGRVLLQLGSLGPEVQELHQSLLRDLTPLVQDVGKRGELLKIFARGDALVPDVGGRIEILKIPTGYRVLESPPDSEEPFRVRDWKTLPPEYQKLIDSLPKPPVPPR